MEMREATFLVVGGGIAGVSCVETLGFLEPTESIILLSESSVIKTVTNVYAITKTLTHFDVEEKEFHSLSDKFSNVTVMHDKLVRIHDKDFYVETENKEFIRYKYLCLCMGAEPKLIPQAHEFANIIGIRDTDSVENFVNKMKHCKKVMIVGNGGIASELVYKIKKAEVFWVIKDAHITATFVDPGAAEFFQSSLNKSVDTSTTITKRMRYQDEKQRSGAALGPDWYKNVIISGAYNDDLKERVKIYYQTEVKSIKQVDTMMEVTLTNDVKVQCDLIVSATGVIPRGNIATDSDLQRSEGNGIQVNQFMQTNLKNIYAAGDICNANWPLAKHWFQMKLWTQARQMGCYAAKSMVGNKNNEEVLQDFCFELFAHSTKLFGYKVILLGLYNGQKLGNNYEVLLRVTKDQEYIKFVIESNRLQGAILIGETDLEEMCENLILNQIDLEPYGDDILNPNIDIEDYFD